MPMIVPPGGFAGFAQQVPAVQRKVGSAIRGVRTNGKRRTGRKKKAAAAGRKRRSGKRKSGRGLLKKGSAAAKRYMAKIRKMRK